MWALFATTLNVSLRALRPHAMARGASRRASAVPLAYYAGARLGALAFAVAGAGAGCHRVGLGGAHAAADAVGAALRRVRATMNALCRGSRALPCDAGAGAGRLGDRHARRNVGLVDIFWSLFFLAAAAVYCGRDADARARAGCSCSALVAVWALRLAGYLAAAQLERAGRSPLPRDPRAQRARLRMEEPVPGVRPAGAARLADLRAARRRDRIGRARSARSMSSGAALVAFGIVFESDRATRSSRASGAAGERRPRHGPRPVALQPASELLRRILRVVGFLPDRARRRRRGGRVFSPLLMTVLLLRVSGVTLLEKDIGERRPATATTWRAPTPSFPGRGGRPDAHRCLPCVAARRVGSGAPAEARSWNFRVMLDGREIGQHRFTLRRHGGRGASCAARRASTCGSCSSAPTATATRRSNAGTAAACDSLDRAHRDQRRARGGDAPRHAAIGSWSTRAGPARRAPRLHHELRLLGPAASLRRDALLNSQTGELVPVTVTPQGDETRRACAARRSPRSAIASAGRDLQIDLWYADGHWVALEALTRGRPAPALRADVSMR